MQAKTTPKPGDLIMAQQLMPLTPLGERTFPDNGSVHRNASASVFMWPADLPAATHRANSILARMALIQYQPGGGADAQAYADIRERAIYVIAGRAKFRLGNSEKQVGAGDLVFAPSRVKHGFEVEGKAPLRIILMEWRSGGYGVREGSDQADLCWGMIASEYHGHRLGEYLLLARLNEIVRQEDVRGVRLATSQHTDGFFQRYGFAIQSRQRNGIDDGLDNVEMQLDLTKDTRDWIVERWQLLSDNKSLHRSGGPDTPLDLESR